MFNAQIALVLMAALAIALSISLTLLLRTRREQRDMLRDMPTGLCMIDEQERIQRWNGQMSRFSGIDDHAVIGKPIASLPDAWSEGIRKALAAPGEDVVKQSLDEDDRGHRRWMVLHASRRHGGGNRFVLVDDITQYQHLQDELLHRERLASIGRLAAGVAHEIGNPVTGIACVAQNLADSADPAELEQGTTEILKQTERITRTVGALMQLSHPGSATRSAECVPCNLADCIDEAVHLLTLDREAAEGSFDNRCDRELLVSADGQLLLQVMLNLLDNARAAAAGSGAVVLDAAEHQGAVMVTIDNAGPAVAAQVLDQAFEPFFTTKDVGEGTGLGLPLVRRMLEDMGGQIMLTSPIPGGNGDGTRAQVTLATATYDGSFAAAP